MKSFDNESTDASVAYVDIDSIIKGRLQGSGFLKKELATDSDVPCATTAVGELRMIDTSEIKISGERFRRVLEVEPEFRVATTSQWCVVREHRAMRLLQIPHDGHPPGGVGFEQLAEVPQRNDNLCPFLGAAGFSSSSVSPAF